MQNTGLKYWMMNVIVSSVDDKLKDLVLVECTNFAKADNVPQVGDVDFLLTKKII